MRANIQALEKAAVLTRAVNELVRKYSCDRAHEGEFDGRRAWFLWLKEHPGVVVLLKQDREDAELLVITESAVRREATSYDAFLKIFIAERGAQLYIVVSNVGSFESPLMQTALAVLSAVYSAEHCPGPMAAEADRVGLAAVH